MKIRISKNCIHYIVVLIILFSTHPYNTQWPIWNQLPVITAGIIAVYVFLYRYSPSKLMLSLLLFFGVNLVVTMVNGNMTNGLIGMFLRLTVFLFFMDMFLKQRPMVFINAFCFFIIVMISVQLYYQIKSPEIFGVASSGNMYNLFASDNMLGYYYVAMMMVFCVRDYLVNGRLKYSLVLVAECVASVIVAWAGAGLVGIIFYATMIIVESLNRSEKKISYMRYYATYIIFYVAVVVFQVQNLFSGFFENVLQKDVTFTGRTLIWGQAIYAIAENPIFGYGSMASGRTTVIMAYNTYVGAHNFILQIIIEVGIVGLIIFAVSMVICGRKIMHCNDAKIRRVILMGILAMFIMYLTEGEVLRPTQYVVLFLAFYAPELEQYCEKERTL
ncbi:O-antigen polymerase [Clostridiales bacterium 1_7_47FAA]|uniref:O-antigen ligase family protein n=1 Tax=Enterocloster hominis (ex Hitch et al. 2024) TaxID=1917870 RepID=A0ABV1DA38_9FIRM|nr:O-antigen polymerase [Clostridiales bacterium 1_7_47FAA]